MGGSRQESTGARTTAELVLTGVMAPVLKVKY